MGSMALIRQFFHDLEWYSEGQAKKKDYAIEAAIKKHFNAQNLELRIKS